MGHKAFVSTHPPILPRLIDIFFSTTISKKFHVKIVKASVPELFLNVIHHTIEYREKKILQRNEFIDILIELKNELVSNETVNGISSNEIVAQTFLYKLSGFETFYQRYHFACTSWRKIWIFKQESCNMRLKRTRTIQIYRSSVTSFIFFFLCCFWFKPIVHLNCPNICFE